MNTRKHVSSQAAIAILTAAGFGGFDLPDVESEDCGAEAARTEGR
jgi:hypothetical protein